MGLLRPVELEMNVGSTDHAAEDIAAADRPQIRLFTIPHITPIRRRTIASAAGPACAGRLGFQRHGLLLRRRRQPALKVPVGLIHTSWGGTPAESWTPRRRSNGEAHVKHMAGHGSKLYNGMIHPLTRSPIAGVIWYQGEANVGRAAQYFKLFPVMIEAWREVWHRPNLPFYFVQIAPFRYNADGGAACAELWAAQLYTMLTVPNTGMAVITDSASVDDIHPRNKRIAGQRLARWALAKTYGQNDVVYSGPIYKEAKPEVQVDADKIRISFDSVGTGLASRDGKPLTGFTVAGADQRFVPATAVIDGNTVLVHADTIVKPVAVRFGWNETAEPNLINKEGLPASPFRTDDWKLVTEGRK